MKPNKSSRSFGFPETAQLRIFRDSTTARLESTMAQHFPTYRLEGETTFAQTA